MGFARPAKPGDIEEASLQLVERVVLQRFK